MSPEICCICLEKDSRYTCPACDSKTCSLECVKRHKLRSECTGSVDPTKFIPNNALGSDPSLVNRDYNYLLNFERKINIGKSDLKDNTRQIFKRNFNQTRNAKRPRLNGFQEEDPRLALVRDVFPNMTTTSLKRENTLVIQLPAGMTRSSQNKSGYDKKSSSFIWTVEWQPINDHKSIIDSFISFRLKETTSLKDAVPASVLAKSVGMDELEKDNLYFYLENCVSPVPRKVSLIPLDAEQSLSTALKDKIVLEFPKIYVFFKPVEHTEFSVCQGYGLEEKESSSEASSTSDSSDSESDLDSESDADSEASIGASDSDSDEGPQEESSKPPAGTSHSELSSGAEYTK